MSPQVHTKIYIGIFFIFLFVLFVFLIFENFQPKESINLTNLGFNFIEKPKFHLSYFETSEYQIKQELLPVLEENANEREYELHVYDCTDFSKSLVKKLTKLGFKAKCMAGSVSHFEYKDHTWVIVEIEGKEYPIESTGGYFINSEEYKNYTIYWEDYCW